MLYVNITFGFKVLESKVKKKPKQNHKTINNKYVKKKQPKT